MEAGRSRRPLDPRPDDVREVIERLARSLRPVYPLETDCGFDELLRALD